MTAVVIKNQEQDNMRKQMTFFSLRKQKFLEDQVSDQSFRENHSFIRFLLSFLSLKGFHCLHHCLCKECNHSLCHRRDFCKMQMNLELKWNILFMNLSPSRSRKWVKWKFRRWQRMARSFFTSWTLREIWQRLSGLWRESIVPWIFSLVTEVSLGVTFTCFACCSIHP